MILNYDFIVISSIITLILTIVVLSYYLPKIIILNTKINESANIVKNIVLELNKRLKNQDKKIIDHEVKIEIIELKLSKIISKDYNVKITKPNTNIEKEIISREKFDSVYEKKNINLNETERIVMNLLSKNDMTSKDIQKSIRKTREHTSRILQKLFINGYIKRLEEKRPFIYKINKD